MHECEVQSNASGLFTLNEKKNEYEDDVANK